MNVYCDNIGVCGSKEVDKTEEQARVKGWHIFHGSDQGGRSHHAVLCPMCVRGKRPPKPDGPPEGQGDLFEG